MEEEIEKIEEAESKYFNSINRISSDSLVEDIFELKDKVDKLSDKAKKLKVELRKKIYTVINSYLTRNRYSVDKICTIKEGEIYDYNSTDVFTLSDLIENISTIRDIIIPDYVKDKNLERIFDILEKNKQVIENLTDIHNFNMSYRADEIPEFYRPDTYYTKKYFYLNYEVSSTNQLCLNQIYHDSPDGIKVSQTTSFSSKKIFIRRDMTDNKIKKIEFLFHSKDIIYNLLCDMKNSINNLIQNTKDILKNIEDNFSKTLVLKKL